MFIKLTQVVSFRRFVDAVGMEEVPVIRERPSDHAVDRNRALSKRHHTWVKAPPFEYDLISLEIYFTKADVGNPSYREFGVS